jgi:Bax protein
VNELLFKVDVIPASLVLAQAANESAWGTSRFALEGNNIFGQWCFEEGCGIIPNRRVEGATHEVKSFDTIEAAIEGYFLNINSHHLYAAFRQERARLRRLGRRLDSMVLAQGLDRYSQRGENYIDEVQTLIQQNDLRQRDRRWMEN